MVIKNERDKVCSMWIDVQEAYFSSFFKGELHYFCGKECKDKFDQNPDCYTVGIVGKGPKF